MRVAFSGTQKVGLIFFGRLCTPTWAAQSTKVGSGKNPQRTLFREPSFGWIDLVQHRAVFQGLAGCARGLRQAPPIFATTTSLDSFAFYFRFYRVMPVLSSATRLKDTSIITKCKVADK